MSIVFECGDECKAGCTNGEAAIRQRLLHKSENALKDKLTCYNGSQPIDRGATTITTSVRQRFITTALRTILSSICASLVNVI